MRVQERAFDRMAYQNPDILWVVAAGNEILWVCSPGTSKNVLTVAASTNSIGHYASMYHNYADIYDVIVKSGSNE